MTYPSHKSIKLKVSIELFLIILTTESGGLAYSRDFLEKILIHLDIKMVRDFSAYGSDCIE